MKNLHVILILIFFSLNCSASDELSCSEHHVSEQSLVEQIIQCELKLEKNIFNNIETIKQSIYLANLYRKTGDTNKSHNLLEEIHSKAKVFGPQGLYEVSFAQGVNSYYSRSFINSLEHFKLAYQYAEELQNNNALANVYNALANVAQVFADYQSMSHLLEKSLAMYKEIGDAKGAIKVINNLGNAYRLNNDDNKALIMYRQALLSQMKQNNRLNAAHTRMNMARSLIKINQQHKAIELLIMSIQDFTEIGAVHRVIEANGLIARVYLTLDDVKSSEKYLKNNRELKLQIDSNHFDPESELVMADFYKVTGKLQLAKQTLINGVNNSREQRNIEQLKKYLNTLASFLAEMEQTKLSNQYWQEYSDVLNEQLEQKKQYFGKLNFIIEPESVNKTEINNKEKQKETISGSQLLWISALIILFSGSSFLIFKNKNGQRKIKAQGNKVLEDTVAKAEPIVETDSSAEQVTFVENKSLIDKTKSIEQGITEEDNTKEDTTVEDNTVEDNTVENKIEYTLIDTRQRLVELMLLATQLWEQETQLGPLELAEQSKIWKVTVDDGRLRIRAMERYLNIEKLPTKPRWRNVIRTCHYVLNKCDKTSSVREELVSKLADYLNIIKQQASR
jgi:tetratricopeptide (TPR) repeat protein